jgi:hypothetical protein
MGVKFSSIEELPILSTSTTQDEEVAIARNYPLNKRRV